MEKLRTPDLSQLPDKVLEVLSHRQMIDHRGTEFAWILNGITVKLKQLFQTRNDLFVFTSSGTGGLGVAIVNTLSPGDKVLSVSTGAFGQRVAEIAQQFGAEVIPVRLE